MHKNENLKGNSLNLEKGLEPICARTKHQKGTEYEKSIKMLMAAIMCFSVFGCSNQSSTETVTNDTTLTSEQTSSDSTSDKTDKNVFYLSNMTDKEEFYLNTVNDSCYLPFEVSFDKNYSKLTCKLYQLDNQSWKNLQEFDLELSGDTFWFLVPDSLLEATVFYKNVNVEQQYSTISTGRPFETIEPSLEFMELLLIMHQQIV